MKLQEVQDLLHQLLSAAGFTIDEIQCEDKGDGSHYINIIPSSDAVLLIGRNGETLRSFQSLLKNIFRTQSLVEDGEVVRIDVDSYRVNQESHVLQMAERRAQQVLETGKSLVLPPMSSYFRRLVHLHIKDKFPALSTFSKGSSNDRCVCVALEDSSSIPVEEERSPDLYAELEL